MKCSKVEIGKIYQSNHNGYFKVIRKLKERNRYYLVEFLDTKFTKEVRLDKILTDEVRDLLRPSRFGVGYMGVGDYSASKKGIGNICGIKWKHMLERCYCPKFQKRFPNYIGCTVAHEGHNFQIFAKWFYENYPKDVKVYELDKDFKVKDNKVYAPNTCIFLSKRDNIVISKANNYKFVNPNGELVFINNLAQYCRTREITENSMGRVYRGERPHHKGWTKYVE